MAIVQTFRVPLLGGALICAFALSACSGSGDGSGFADLESGDGDGEAASCAPLPMEGKVVVGYLPGWVGDYQGMLDSLDLDTLTHLNLAFTNPDEASGETVYLGVSSEQLHDLVALAHEHDVKVMASIGGINHSEQINKRIQPDVVEEYIDDLERFADEFDIDGIDVDIEGSHVDSTYGPFVEKLAKRLHPKGLLVTAAVASWFQEGVVNQALDCFDFINVMAYDGAGSWTGPDEHASRDWAQATVQYWNQTRGVDASRVVLGLPFYGYCWGTGCPYGSEGHQIDFEWINENYPDAVAGDWVRDDESGITVNFNGTDTIEAKTRFAQDYGGVMIWEMSQDSADALLFGALRKGLE